MWTVYGACIDRADLMLARLGDADFREASLQGSRLDDSMLRYADFSEARGLSVEQLLAARLRGWAVLPCEFADDPRTQARVAEFDGLGGLD
ncbi:pentapeptide repeat-containing protein [Streptomyces sp. NPDC020607]|uniref:pentapeptide repeat-containing protein n=1 Tax=Streptomyces sp. NPDC020607 TaxID=3365082 RepID=UPI0037A362A4